MNYKILRIGFMITAIALASAAIGNLLMTNYISSLKQTPEDIKINKVEPEVFKAPCDTCVYIDKLGITNEQNNPILRVSIYTNGELLKSYRALSGRADTQNLDRNVANNESPSPNGEYIIQPETKGYIAETGGVFLPYEPLFETQRTSLGFHTDPSWGQDNGEDGTSGCVAVKDIKEYKDLVKTIENNNITRLIINY